MVVILFIAIVRAGASYTKLSASGFNCCKQFIFRTPNNPTFPLTEAENIFMTGIAEAWDGLGWDLSSIIIVCS